MEGQEGEEGVKRPKGLKEEQRRVGMVQWGCDKKHWEKMHKRM